jgi:hypothetical protein
VDGWIVIPGWPKFQHYKDRDPTWIKNYTRLLHDDAYDELTLAATGLLHVSWLLYAVSGGVLAVSQLRRFCTAKGDSRHFQHHLDSLIRAGFVQVVASKPLALARSREVEVEKEKKDLKILPSALKTEEPKPAPPASSSHRTNVVAADGFAAIERMIRNGVIHDDLDLDAELRGYRIDGHLAESLHEQLERRLTSEQR